MPLSKHMQLLLHTLTAERFFPFSISGGSRPLAVAIGA